MTAVGGTEFNPNYDNNKNDSTYGADIGFVPEAVWNDIFYASGGGQSSLFFRYIPNISLGGSPISPGFWYVPDGANGPAAVKCCVGGTSIATPMWAGISKLISELQGGTRVGNMNSRFGTAAGIRPVYLGDNTVW